MIDRDLAHHFRGLAQQFPAVTLTGPRQSGKSTLCRAMFPHLGYANLEAPDVRSFALDDPRGFLAQFPKGAVIDEVQRVPDLPSYLQEMIDRDPTPGKWILTGSQNLALESAVSQSLAGRTAVLHLLPLSRSEVIRFDEYPRELNDALLAGGYPRIFDRQLDPHEWLGAYVSTYLERDVRMLSNIGDLSTFQRFVELCAGRTAQLLKLSSLAADCGVSQPTVKAWLSILETSFIAFRLPPWSGNLRKRLVKTPKLHFYDSGLVCRLLGIRTADQLALHPLRGAIFETWVVSEIIKHRLNGGVQRGVSFYRDRSGGEIDLLVEDGARKLLIEVKAGQTVTSDSFKPLRRIGEALQGVGEVDRFLIYGGESAQERSEVMVLPWSNLHAQAWG